MLRRRLGRDTAEPSADDAVTPRAAATPPPSPRPFSVILALAISLIVLAVRPSIEDASSLYSAESDFDAESAESLVTDLCAFGQRPAGSAAAEQARLRLLSELEAIRKIARASPARPTLEVEEVRASGAFYTDFIDGFTNVYHNSSSIVARLSWPHSRRDAVLLAAHYDTFPGSPGGSDNAANVAAAFGTIRALAGGPPLRLSFLLLLNGGEESNWVAAHAFATGGHSWAKDYRVVINLEAIGSGGESIVFQLGPDAPWLAKALGRSAIKPRGTVIAHDLFQIPGFPAGTDLKTLLVHAPASSSSGRAAGGGPLQQQSQQPSVDSQNRPVGIDLAILGNGYIYHTPSDDLAHAGSKRQLKRVGGGATSIARVAAEALNARLNGLHHVELHGHLGRQARNERLRAMMIERTLRLPHDNPQRLDEEAGDVFFDFCGWVWIAYTSSQATRYHAAAALLAFMAMYASNVRTRHLLKELKAVFYAILSAVAAGVLLWLFNPMATFGQSSLAIAIYTPLGLAVSITIRDASHDRHEPSLTRDELWLTRKDGSTPFGSGLGNRRAANIIPSTARTFGAAGLGPLLLLFALFELGRLGSAYLPALFCGLNGLALLIASFTTHFANAPFIALVVQMIGAVLPVLHLHSISSWLLEVILPITGRAGVLIPTDPVIGLLVSIVAITPSGTLLAPLHAANLARHLPRPLICLSVVALFIASSRSPFTPTAPKRLLVQHITREVDGVQLDSGLWVSGFDAAKLDAVRNEWSSLGLPAIRDSSHHGCDLDAPDGSTSCYYSFPFYFPLSGMLGTPDGKGAVYAKEMTSTNGQKVSVQPPTVTTTARRLSLEAIPANRSGDGNSHRVNLRLSGPSHMALILPEDRLVGWSLAPGTPPPRRPPVAPRERVVFAFCTSEAAALEDGVDLNGTPRVWELWIEVSGSEPLDIAAYAHYLDTRNTAELDVLAQRLPEAAKAGTWHWFASMLAKRTVAFV